MFGLEFIVHRTRIGKAIRAMGQNRTGAALVGIRISQVTAVVFVLGSAMAGAAGVLYGSLFAITPYMAAAPLMKYAERIFSRQGFIDALTPSEKAMRK